MKKYRTKDIPPDCFFSEPVFLDDKIILTAPEMPFSKAIKQALEDWGFDEVYSAGEPKKDRAAGGLNHDGGGDLLDDLSLGDGEKMMKAEEFYADFTKYVEILFAQVTARNELSHEALAEKMKTVCETIREDWRYLLRVRGNSFSGPNKNYIASHTVKTTIFSIIIGLQLKLSEQKLAELGLAALLHEIGMTKLPPQMYLTRHPLLPLKQKVLLTHPDLGYDLLKAYDFPPAVSLAALEHHERENGSGYPKKLLGKKISPYAKIIAVACSYEALSAKRPHKKAKDDHAGILELLKNDGKKYDDTVVRALAHSLSIYPIGSYVLLSSGRTGQVVDVNPETPRFPIVQVTEGQKPDDRQTIETSQDGISIIRPLSKEETEQELTSHYE